MYSTQILQHLKKHGQQLDSEIATAMKIPLSDIQDSLSDLSAKGEISRCTVIRFPYGKPVEGTLYRAIGFIPPKTPGRKPGVS